MRVDIWSDIVCPWCYVGVVRLERALAEAGIDDAELVFRSFELDPTISAEGEPLEPYLARKFGDVARVRAGHARLIAAGAEVGIDYRFEGMWRRSSFDAHRLLHWALSTAGEATQVQLEHRLLRAHFTEGQNVADRGVLAALAAEVGLERDLAAETLASGDFADQVREDEARAAAMGISAVPTFVIDGRYAVQGAQDIAAWRQVLDQIAADAA